MREGWLQLTLEDVLERQTSRLGTSPEPRLLTVTEGNGLVDQLEHWGRRVAIEDVSQYKLVEPGDIAYNVYLLWLGAIGQNLFDEVGVTSPVYEVFRPREGVDSRYIGLLVSSPGLVERYGEISIGTVPRRRRAPWQSFLTVPVTLPPLTQQRRIVDLIGTLDDTIAAAKHQAGLAERTLARARDLLPHGKPVPLAAVLKSIDSGVSTKPVIGDGPRQNLLTLAAIRPGVFRPAEIKDVGVAALPERARLRDGDLLITRSNTPERVGYVARARDVAPDTFIPDLVWRLVPDGESVSQDYLAQLLSSPTFRSAITATATGTSPSMQKINKANFSSIRIPLPPLSAQEAYVEPLLALVEAVDATRRSGAALRILRSNLLTALLSGEHEIPETYDEVLQEAV